MEPAIIPMLFIIVDNSHIKNSEDYTILKNKTEEYLNDFLNPKKDLFKLSAETILNLIKQDPTKDILISIIINSNGNLGSQSFLDSYEEKVAEIAADTIFDIALEININDILNS
ncbi:MAG TPA: hypothetical protein VFV86_01025 [Nitrososphaeraceae archaeon]|nr:hypothetical protein [Nitrososphaeraceae archaeon]